MSIDHNQFPKELLMDFLETEYIWQVQKAVLEKYGNIKVAFIVFDANNDHFIFASELSEKLVEKGISRETEKHAIFFNYMDNDRDGKISWTDWNNGFYNVTRRIQSTRDKLVDISKQYNSQYLSQSIEILNQNLAQTPQKERLESAPASDNKYVYDLVDKYASEPYNSSFKGTPDKHPTLQYIPPSTDRADRDLRSSSSTGRFIEKYPAKEAVVENNFDRKPMELSPDYDENINYLIKMKQQDPRTGNTQLSANLPQPATNKLTIGPLNRIHNTIGQSAGDNQDSTDKFLENNEVTKQDLVVLRGFDSFHSPEPVHSEHQNTHQGDNYASPVLGMGKGFFLQDTLLERVYSGDFPRLNFDTEEFKKNTGTERHTGTHRHSGFDKQTGSDKHIGTDRQIGDGDKHNEIDKQSGADKQSGTDRHNGGEHKGVVRPYEKGKYESTYKYSGPGSTVERGRYESIYKDKGADSYNGSTAEKGRYESTNNYSGADRYNGSATSNDASQPFPDSISPIPRSFNTNQERPDVQEFAAYYTGNKEKKPVLVDYSTPTPNRLLDTNSKSNSEIVEVMFETPLSKDFSKYRTPQTNSQGPNNKHLTTSVQHYNPYSSQGVQSEEKKFEGGQPSKLDFHGYPISEEQIINAGFSTTDVDELFGSKPSVYTTPVVHDTYGHGDNFTNRMSVIKEQESEADSHFRSSIVTQEVKQPESRIDWKTPTYDDSPKRSIHLPEDAFIAKRSPLDGTHTTLAEEISDVTNTSNVLADIRTPTNRLATTTTKKAQTGFSNPMERELPDQPQTFSSKYFQRLTRNSSKALVSQKRETTQYASNSIERIHSAREHKTSSIVIPEEWVHVKEGIKTNFPSFSNITDNFYMRDDDVKAPKARVDWEGYDPFEDLKANVRNAKSYSKNFSVAEGQTLSLSELRKLSDERPNPKIINLSPTRRVQSIQNYSQPEEGEGRSAGRLSYEPDRLKPYETFKILEEQTKENQPESPVHGNPYYFKDSPGILMTDRELSEFERSQSELSPGIRAGFSFTKDRNGGTMELGQFKRALVGGYTPALRNFGSFVKTLGTFGLKNETTDSMDQDPFQLAKITAASIRQEFSPKRSTHEFTPGYTPTRGYSSPRYSPPRGSPTRGASDYLSFQGKTRLYLLNEYARLQTVSRVPNSKITSRM